MAVLITLVFANLPVAAKTLLLLPISGETEKTEDMPAVNALFRSALELGYAGNLVSPPAETAPCADKACAQSLADSAGADEVVFTSLTRLGSKWIFTGTRMGRDGSGVFRQSLAASNIEDMEAVTRRVADALNARKSLEQVASLDNITEKEETKEPVRRRSLFAGGLALGYLFPMNGSYESWKEGGYPDYEPRLKTYSQLIELTWLNTWEFRDDLLLDVDASLVLPVAVGMDLNVLYLFRRGDFSPFAGGGVGLHYVFPDDLNDDDKRNSGPTGNIQAGMIFFRTYDIHVLARAQYQMVLNTDYDNGFSVDVGVTYQKSRDREESGWVSFWKYYLIGALFFGIMGAAT